MTRRWSSTWLSKKSGSDCVKRANFLNLVEDRPVEVLLNFRQLKLDDSLLFGRDARLHVVLLPTQDVLPQN